MNKTITATIVALLGISPVAHAKILSPSLITPQNNEVVGLKQPLTFSWSAKNPTTIKQYHLIISSNDRFMDYDVGKGKCVKASTSCVDFITQSTSYPMAKTHSFLQKEGSYFWQVVATGKTGDRSLIFQGSENTSTGTANTRKQVNINQFSVAQKFVDIDSVDVAPREAANGSSFDFSVLLTDELPDGQSIQIDYGDGWKIMTGTGLNYSYQHAFTVPVSIKDTPVNFTVAVFDDNGEQQRRLDDYITILANNVAPTLSFVSGADSVVKNKAYTLKLKANDDDGNLARIEVNWGDGSSNDSKTATNNTTLTFSHTYKFAGIQNLIATAFDDTENTSDEFTKSITVTDSTVSVPSVSSFNASPQSVTQGDPITFSATLSTNLPTGYTVKINYGNGFVKMNGSGTSFNLTAAPASSAAYKIGIYDSNNTLKGVQSTGNFQVTAAPPVNSPPVVNFYINSIFDKWDEYIRGAVVVGQTYSVSAKGSDVDGNLYSVSVDWGDGTNNTQNAVNNQVLNFTHIYTQAGSYSVNLVAMDSDGVKDTGGVSKTVTVSKPTTGYTKIANNGSTLSDSAKLGTAPTDWACTKDNKTGLIWEVKTNGGLRDMTRTYTNYTADYPKCGEDCYYNGESKHPGQYGNEGNTDIFVATVNQQTLCGANDWRVPTVDESKGIIKSDTSNSAIDSFYFPNTQSGWFWTSSLSDIETALLAAGNNTMARGAVQSRKPGGMQTVSFISGQIQDGVDYLLHGAAALHDGLTTFKGSKNYIRLVRVITVPDTGYTKIANNGSLLSDDAKLGTAPTDWACTKDNKTGLIWEVKTTDGGLRDKDWYYSWYEPDASKNDGFAGYQ
ncbi:MAG: DUF1566 domain-containing protein, partial [Methylococcales bacterium]|nr:DUF1566 domain-containing protein [Methylococcales bacterium]